MPIAEARRSGATMLFGEKYGDTVRVVTFDPDFSSELCGGTHVPATGELGLFKIVAESAVAAGVRRIEAVTAAGARDYVNERLASLEEIRELVKGSSDPVRAVATLQEENRSLRKELERQLAARATALKGELASQLEEVNGVRLVAARVPLSDATAVKTLVHQLTAEHDRALVLLGSENDGKALLTLGISRDVAGKGEGQYDAGALIREFAKHIRGGGGGQPFFATAGGKDPGGLDAALAAARKAVAG